MNTKTCLLLFVLLAAGTFASAQNVGYMGKKLNVFAEGFFSPALDNPSRAQTTAADRIGVNSRFQVGAEWVVSRQRYVGVQAGMMLTGLAGSIQVNDTDYSSGFPIITQYYVTGSARLSAFPIGISTGHSRRNNDYIMPLGHYRTHTILFIPYMVTDSKGVYGRKDQKMASGLAVAYLFGIGKQMIFFDNMTFRYGMQFGLVLTGDWDDKLAGTRNTFTSTAESDIREMANDRLQGAMKFNVNIGVGYLLK